MRIALAFALSGLIAGPAVCETGDFVAPGMILVEAGIFCPEEASGRMEAPDTDSGYIDLLSGDVRAAFVGRVVPGQLTMGFGLRYQRAQGLGFAQGRMIVTHPPLGNGGMTQQSYPVLLDDTGSNMSQYDFDFPYEVQFGTWTMAIELEGEIVLQQSFEVVPPGIAPFTLDDCEGPVPMS